MCVPTIYERLQKGDNWIKQLPFDPAQIHLLCFDVDGTLRDTDDEWVQMLSSLLRKLRLVLPTERESWIARRLIMALEDPVTFLYSLLDRFGIDALLARLGERLPRERRTRRMTNNWLIPGVDEMLNQLHARYKLAIVSARGARSTLEFLEQFDLLKFFSALATAQTCEKTKPYPDPLLWVMQSIGVAPEQCLMIGDTTVDIKAGRAAGCKTIGVLCGFGEREELQRAGADVIMEKTTDLLELFA